MDENIIKMICSEMNRYLNNYQMSKLSEALYKRLDSKDIRTIETEDIRDYLSYYQGINNCNNITIDEVRRTLSTILSRSSRNMSDELINGIYVSIKQEPTSKIVQGIKNHEFRNYIPKKSFKFMYVYVTAPQSQLKYVIEIGNIVKFPEQLEITGDGNLDFNKGKKSKYAYPIIKVYELTNPISLEELKSKFGFVPPQAFSYAETYTELTEHIVKAKKVVIINR